MTEQELPEDIADMSFEEALAALESVVRQLEEGDISLDNAIQFYVRGSQLKHRCEVALTEAQAQIEKITERPSP